ncbi:MAG: acyltransferase family protein [Xanthobacteraceae bacterium]
MHKTIEWIQGLRAVAVLAVIIYHLDHALLPGGFLGVDLFFVISGFLITRKLVREAEETGAINAIAFWGGRAKRLLPNALLVLLTVLVATAALLPPYRLAQVSTDITSAALFMSNYLFAGRAADYFHFNDTPSPILHFWSLSIEEQYYFGLPLVLIALSFLFPKRRVRAIAIFLFVAFAASLAICVLESQSSSTSAFFHTQSRIWQLALGGIVGLNFERADAIPRLSRAALAYLGAGSFLLCVALYNNDIGYPGIWAIAPTLASALILAGTPATKHLANGLAIKPMTAIGDRSYSLYLWHWPVLALTAEIWPDNLVVQTLAIPLFVGLAYISYATIEKPIHESKSFPAWRVPIGVTAIGAICVASYLLAAMPRPPALAARAEAIKQASSDFSRIYADHCHLTFDETQSPPCTYGNIDGNRTVVLFGDSHAAQWFDALEKAAKVAGWRLIARTKTSCPSAMVPIWAPFKKAYYGACDKWRQSVFEELRELRPDLVILANYSRFYGWIYDSRSKTFLPRSKSELAWREGYRQTLRELDKIGSATVVVHDNPKLLKSYADCLSYRTDCGNTRSNALGGMDDDLPGNVQILDFNDSICNGSWCPAEKNGTIIYQDEHHLTASYAATFWDDFLRVLKDHSGPSDRQKPQESDAHTR